MKNILLSEMPFGSDATVVSIDGDGSIVRRLMEMGLIPGTPIKLVKSAPFGDPIEIKIKGYSLAIRRAEAGQITVIPKS